jgi:hypothetical protein
VVDKEYKMKVCWEYRVDRQGREYIQEEDKEVDSWGKDMQEDLMKIY